MDKYLTFFDFFSQIPTLRVNGKTRPFTKLSSLVGFISIIFLFTGIGFLLYDYFMGLSYRNNFFIDNTATPEIDIQKLKIGFLLTDYTGREFPDIDRIITVQAKFWNIYLPIEFNKTVTVDFEDIGIINCNSFKKEHLFVEAFDAYSKIFKNQRCLDTENYEKNLFGSYANFGK